MHFYFLAIIFVVHVSGGQPKDAKHVEKPQILLDNKYDPEFREIKSPFRIAKLNLIWSKAQNRLTEPKLKSLYMELKIHDKEEMTWKQLNSQHKDKDGLKTNELRQKLIGILSTYDLLEYFEETEDKEKVKPFKKFHEDDKHINKSLFKDKKLNRLWGKAEISGFTQEELNALKEEFQHHENKIADYYSLLDHVGSKQTDKHANSINEDELEDYNLISNPNENEIDNPGSNLKKYESNINQLRDQHRGIKDHYDRLERMVASGPHSEEFIEPKVQGLWRVAQASNFTATEISSIKAELLHFQTRLLKLRNLHAEHAMFAEKHKNKNGKTDSDMEDHIKKQSRKVEKIQENVEKMIFKHSEL